MAVYKDQKKGTWYTSFHYKDWTGKNCRKLKRGFATKKEALEWETSFLRTKASKMDMTFGEFVTVYEQDVRPKLKENVIMFLLTFLLVILVHRRFKEKGVCRWVSL